MKYIKIFFGMLLICFYSANAEFKLLYEGDGQIQWHDFYYNGTTIIAAGYILDLDNLFFEGEILVSNDGGKNWTLNKEINVFLKSIAVNSESKLFIGGFGPGIVSYLFTSSNNGKNWLQSLEDVHNSGITHVQFFGENKGIALGYGNDQFTTGVVYITTDKGSSWNAISGNIDWINFDESRFFNDSIGYGVNNISGETYSMAKTTNGGKNWTELQLSDELKLDGVYFWSENEFIVGGLGGRMDKTTDGGKNWMKLQTGTTNQIRGICFDGNIGYAVGTKGLILKSTDRGLSWVTIDSEFKTIFNNVKIYGSNIFVFGESGTIIMEGNLDVEKKLTLDRSNIIFEDAEVELTKTEKISITNNSTLPIKITEINLINNAELSFTMNNITLPITLNQNDKIDIDINFSPKTAKTFNAELNIVSNADINIIKIPVTGKGLLSSSIIEKSEYKKGMIYPNPAENQIHLTLNPDYLIDITEIGIYDINGKLIKNFITPQSINYVLDISNISTGTYILLIQSENKYYYENFIRK